MKGSQGISSKNVRHTTAPKSEPRPHARNPAAVAQYGGLVGNHITSKSSTRYRGEPDYARRGYQNPVGPSSMALSGPGAGREVLRSGGQGQHGQVNPGKSPERRGLLSEFGPDVPGRK
jgi:hypothetical protein